MKCIEKDCGAEYEPRDIQKALGNLFGTGVPSPGRCPACRKLRFARQDEREKAKEAVRQAAIAPKRREWRQTCGIPAFFMDKDFKSFEQARQPGAFKVASEYAAKFPLGHQLGYPWLVLVSFPAKGTDANGLGKTHLAVSIIHTILDNWQGEDIRKPAYFITEPDLIASIQATYSLSWEQKALRESESEIINRLALEPLLVLDDIGKVRRHDQTFTQEKLFALIDMRYRRRLPMVITTNLASADLEDYLGTASMDRIIEMSKGHFKTLKGRSYRRPE